MLKLTLHNGSSTVECLIFEAALGGLDAVIFSGGIGAHYPYTCTELLAGIAEQDLLLDPSLNGMGCIDSGQRISLAESKVAVLRVPSQEDLMISLHVTRMAASYQN